MDTGADLTTVPFEELRRMLRQASSRSFSTVGDEKAQAASIHQWAAPMTVILEEILRRDLLGEIE